MLTKIWLVRHGEVPSNTGIERYTGPADEDLTERGVLQAERTARRLLAEDIDAAYSSGLTRAAHTAEIIVARRGVEIARVAALNEVDFGEWAGLTREQAAARDPEEFAAWMEDSARASPPGGEALLAAAERAWTALEAIAERERGRTVLIVSHKAINRLLAARIMGLEAGQFRRLGQDNCAVNLLVHEDGRGWMVESINDTVHLRGV